MPDSELTTTYRDDLGRVFDRMQRQRGECFDFPMGFATDDLGPITWQWYSHIAFDGIGALADLARQHGAPLAVPALRVRADRDATLLEHLRPFTRRSYLRAAPRSSWDREPPTPTTRRLPQHVIRFSLEDTARIAATARALEVSVSSLVLWALATAARALALRPNDRQHWTIPVNMRGGIAMSTTAANQLSFVRVPIRLADTAETIHGRLYDLLESGTHWVMLKWIAFFANRKRMKFPPVRSTGCLSNLGSFEAAAPGLARVVFSPPIGATEPIAVGVISWNGRMSLALTVHDTLAPPDGAIAELGEHLKRLLLDPQPVGRPA